MTTHGSQMLSCKSHTLFNYTKVFLGLCSGWMRKLEYKIPHTHTGEVPSFSPSLVDFVVGSRPARLRSSTMCVGCTDATAPTLAMRRGCPSSGAVMCCACSTRKRRSRPRPRPALSLTLPAATR
jgi:hypothetical protein